MGVQASENYVGILRTWITLRKLQKNLAFGFQSFNFYFESLKKLHIAPTTPFPIVPNRPTSSEMSMVSGKGQASQMFCMKTEPLARRGDASEFSLSQTWQKIAHLSQDTIYSELCHYEQINLKNYLVNMSLRTFSLPILLLKSLSEQNHFSQYLQG